MLVVTVVTDPGHPGLRRFLEPSCAFRHLRLVVLRSLAPMRRDRGGSYREKDRSLLRYLEDVPGDELVLFTDGYDTMVLAEAEEIEAKFAALGHAVVLSAELELWPPVPALAEAYPEMPGPARYPNSGGMIGRARDLRALLGRVEAIAPDGHAPWSNQYRWIRCLIADRGAFGLDHGSTLFFAAAPRTSPSDYEPWGGARNALQQAEFLRMRQRQMLERFTMSEGRIRIEPDALPCHVHFNGPCSWLLDEDPSPLRPIMPWLG